MKVMKIIGIIVASVVGLVVIAVGVVYVLSSQKIGREHPLPAVSVTVPASDSAVARGKHLVEAVGSCLECHSNDLGGKVVMDAGPIGRAVATNLTRGTGGVAAAYEDADWVYAIRHGMRRDGKSLLIMPSEAYTHFTDDDLGAMIAYLKQVPPVDREMPRSTVRLLGRALLVTGQMPMLSAELVPQVEARAAPALAPTAEYGRYLAGVSGCTGCHGPDLTGGIPGPPETPVSANLTPAALGSWTEADFFRALREGKRPDGSAINEFMPWRYMSRMSDDELRALWLYVQSVPAKATAVR